MQQQKKKVVLFEDTPDHLSTLQKCLEAANCEVMAFSEPTISEEVNAKLRTFQPSIAVIDGVFMDAVDGLKIAMNLVELDPKILIILCSILLSEPIPPIIEDYRRIRNIQGWLPKIQHPDKTWNLPTSEELCQTLDRL